MCADENTTVQDCHSIKTHDSIGCVIAIELIGDEREGKKYEGDMCEMRRRV
jgi:hypothetical protein